MITIRPNRPSALSRWSTKDIGFTNGCRLIPVAQKPPFFGWVSTISYELTRWWDLAWRLPSLLSALAISILLLRAASLAYGRTAGLISLGAFGFNLLSARLATLVATDMLLALSIFLAGLLIWQKIRSGNAWNSRDRWWFFGLLTMSLFIKGPVVYAFLLLGIAAFAWRKRSDKVTSAPGLVCGRGLDLLQFSWSGSPAGFCSSPGFMIR